MTKEEYSEWINNEITKEVFFELRTVRSELSKNLENGITLKGGMETIEETAKIVGILYGIDLILEIKV